MITDRVFVTLERGPDGYPPWDEEEIWAIPVGDHLFQLDAVPTFVRGLSHRDVVHVVPVGDRWYVDRVEEWNGHSTIRVVLFDDGQHDPLVELGRRHGVDVDHTELAGLFAIDVPPAASYHDIVRDLADGHARGWWDFEVGAVSTVHDATDSGAGPAADSGTDSRTDSDGGSGDGSGGGSGSGSTDSGAGGPPA